MRYQEIPGHEELKKRLIRSVNNGRLGHAQLFTGEDGSAALSLALATSQYIMCEDRQEKDSCGRCRSCLKHEKMIHPDLHYAFPVIRIKGNKENLSRYFLEQWRETLIQNPFLSLERWYKALGIQNQQGTIYTAESDEIIRELSLKSFESDYKILVIWLPEKLETTAANKLLKVIEEPPEKTFFFLVSRDPEKMLPTILSRCQHLPVPGIPDQELSGFLATKYSLPDKQAALLAVTSEGNIGRAIQEAMLPEEEKQHLQSFIRWMRLCYTLGLTGLLGWIDEMSSSGREHQKSFLSYSLHMLRENFILNTSNMISRLNSEELEFSKKFSGFIHSGNIHQLYQLINDTFLHIESNANPRIVLLDTSFKIYRLIKN
ncbi:MAG: DNA polymerase III subunit delta [Chlorobi bacterium]|nr:DNA polymerase III subunit delta [Chlorobiota bacterium]